MTVGPVFWIQEFFEILLVLVLVVEGVWLFVVPGDNRICDVLIDLSEFKMHRQNRQVGK